MSTPGAIVTSYCHVISQELTTEEGLASLTDSLNHRSPRLKLATNSPFNVNRHFAFMSLHSIRIILDVPVVGSMTSARPLLPRRHIRVSYGCAGCAVRCKPTLSPAFHLASKHFLSGRICHSGRPLSGPLAGCDGVDLLAVLVRDDYRRRSQRTTEDSLCLLLWYLTHPWPC